MMGKAESASAAVSRHSEAADLSVHIDPYRPEDRAAVEDLLVELDGEHADRVPDHMTRLLALVAIDAAAILVARDPAHGRPIAALTLERIYWNVTSYVEDLIVHDGFRNSGIGAALLDASCGISRAWGCRRLYLTTSVRNRPAQRFYLRHGFVPEGIRPDWSAPGDHEMSLYLDL
jgi:GNAT superfamily N-acetyltransferase